MKAILLTLMMTLSLFALCSLCHAVAHAVSVRRVGVGTVVVVGRKGDPLLPQRVRAAYDQNRFCHLEDGGAVLVLDCGLTRETKAVCVDSLGGDERVVFLPAEKLAEYVLATSCEK